MMLARIVKSFFDQVVETEVAWAYNPIPQRSGGICCAAR